LDEQSGGELIKSKVKANRSLRELLQQRLGLLEIGSVKALGKPCAVSVIFGDNGAVAGTASRHLMMKSQ
jgi:hypothetical protein